MRENWRTYCLMSGIAIIEEFSKPSEHKWIDKKLGKEYSSYQSIRLKMKDEKIVNWWLNTTRIWEKKLNQEFISNNFKKVHRDGDQYTLHFLPNWAYHILKEIKKFPSEYTNSHYLNKIRNWKISKNNYIISRSEITQLEQSTFLHDKLLKNKFLAAGAFIVSFDLEFRGCQTGRLDLTMSDKYKDFLEYMLKIANKYGWATQNNLSNVSINHSIIRGIKASPQYCFRIKTQKLKEIYKLAGPLLNKDKDKCIKFHTKRSSNYINRGGSKKGYMKKKLYNLIKKIEPTTTTKLQFQVNIGTDVILDHLNKLFKEGLINKKRKGKRYIWSIKNANKRRL